MNQPQTNSIFHERQSMEMCCMHALNNLLQSPAFNKATMDTICKNLAPDSYTIANPHRSPLGWGNYDVNVLIAALQTKDCAAIWDPHCLDLDNIIGFILNIPSQPSIGPITIPFIHRRHWIAVRYLGGAYYNLDSKLKQPEMIGESDAFLAWLNDHLNASDKQIFVIVTTNVEREQSFLHPPYRSTAN